MWFERENVELMSLFLEVYVILFWIFVNGSKRCCPSSELPWSPRNFSIIEISLFSIIEIFLSLTAQWTVNMSVSETVN